MKYSHSDNEELFHGQFDTHEEALADALSEYADADFVYVAEAHQRTIGHYINEYRIENLLESMAEAAGEEVGECAEDWLAPPGIQRKKDESKEDYQVRVEAWRKAKADRLAFLLDGFRIVLETWATDAGEQPSFWHVGNANCYDMNGCLVD